MILPKITLQVGNNDDYDDDDDNDDDNRDIHIKIKINDLQGIESGGNNNCNHFVLFGIFSIFALSLILYHSRLFDKFRRVYCKTS